MTSNLPVLPVHSIKVHASDRSQLWKVQFQEDGAWYLMKDSQTPEQDRLANEETLTAGSGDFKDVFLGTYQDRPVLVREWKDGTTLAEMIAEGPVNLTQFLNLALGVAKKLLAIHQRGILHRDISPANILVGQDGTSTWFIDFELATRLMTADQPRPGTQPIEGNLTYISPEQTGRMNRRVDHRSDYYSLGAVFYELLTGRPPFLGSDPLELIHAHLARDPITPHLLRDGVPRPLGKLVLKLLEKNSENRYQSLEGLIQDLENIRQQWTRFKTVEDFDLGQAEVTRRLRVSQKLYNRQAEKAILETAFAQIIQGGVAFVRLHGAGGMGKTTLARELTLPVTKAKGMFLEGGFDELNQNLPFTGWIQILDRFARAVLSGSEVEILAWRQKLSAHLEGLGALLTGLAPELSEILGPQTELPPVPALENIRRLTFAFTAFLKAAGSAENPVVVFLDDLQWADHNSLDLLKNLMESSELGHLLLVTAYRDDNPAIPTRLNLFLPQATHDLPLNLLEQSHIQDLLADSIPEPAGDLADLAKIIYTKTHGNPYSILQLLQVLQEKQILGFDETRQAWVWDTSSLLTQELSDNVVERLLERFQSLPEDQLALIRLASVFGGTFSLGELSLLSGKRSAAVHRLLWPLIQNGTLIPTDRWYKFIPEFFEEKGQDLHFAFSHQRLQKAVYSLLTEQERQSTHFDLALLLNDTSTPEVRERRIFDLANHILLGAAFLTGHSRQAELVQLLVTAGLKSFESSAFASAQAYLSAAWPLLRLPAKEKFRLLLMLIETAALKGDQNLYQVWMNEAWAQSPDLEEKLEIYTLQIRSLTILGRMLEAVDLARTALLAQGLKIPEKASLVQVILGAVKLGGQLTPARIARLSPLPDPMAQDTSGLVRLLASAMIPYYFTNIATYPLIIFESVAASLRGNLIPESLVGLASHGLLLLGPMGQPQAGFDLVRKALALTEPLKAGPAAATVRFVDNVFATIQFESIKPLPQRCREAAKEGIRTGNMEYAGFNQMWNLIFRWFLGENFSDLRAETAQLLSFLRQYNQKHQEPLTELMLDTFDCWLDEALWTSQNLLSPKTEALAQKAKDSGDTVTLNAVYHFAGSLRLWQKDFGNAFGLLMEAKKLGQGGPLTFFQAEEPFLVAWAGLQALRCGQKVAAGQVRKQAKATLKLLTLRAARNPEVFGWMRNLIQALLQEDSGREVQPLVWTELTTAATRAGFRRHSALMAELALDRTNLPAEIRQQLLTLARRQYSEGGLPLLAARLPQAMLDTGSTAGSTELTSAALDNLSLIKATEVLVGEIHLESLLDRLLTIGIENAGAQKGFFLLADEAGWHVELLVSMIPEKTTERLNVALEDLPYIAPGVVRLAQHTAKPVIIDDVAKQALTTRELAGHSSGAKSILAIPFIHHGKTTGIIYLTHEATTNAFSLERIRLLKILAGQIGTSLENALLYRNLENMVDHRTAQLIEEKRRSEDLLLNILPREVAEELKTTGRSTARHHEAVTVLFADIKDFTKFAESVSPQELISELDNYFRNFDRIIGEHGLEKIKTIGDAYFCAGGLPEPNPHHAQDVVAAGQAILAWVKAETARRQALGKTYFQIRIGIHSGPVVAGVVGDRKFAYDIWGDTVNIAARMEQAGEVGRINLSGTTWALVKNDFKATHRGQLEAKNKGQLDMYFVD